MVSGNEKIENKNVLKVYTGKYYRNYSHILLILKTIIYIWLYDIYNMFINMCMLWYL